MPTGSPLRVLLLEDSEADAELLTHELERTGLRAVTERVDSKDDFILADDTRRLRLSVKTIETHRSEVMKRLGIHDVVALVRYAVRVGLVSLDSGIV